MNSSEQKDFEYITPTEAEVGETSTIISEMLADPNLDKDVILGYEWALHLLSHSTNEFPAPEKPSVKTSAIVAAAMDYIDGKCSREVLLSFA